MRNFPHASRHIDKVEDLIRIAANSYYQHYFSGLRPDIFYFCDVDTDPQMHASDYARRPEPAFS